MMRRALAYAGQRLLRTLKVGAALLMVSLAIYAAGDHIEMRFWPITDGGHATNIVREQNRVCFHWHVEKYRRASPRGFEWWYTAANGDGYLASPKNKDGTSRAVRTFEPGPIDIEMCVHIEEGAQAMGGRITGSVAYLPPHRQWIVRHPMPPIDVPGP